MVTSSQPDGWAPAPAIVALGIIILVGGVTISAIFHYSSVDDALKFWTALTGLVGVITGAFVAYFFTRPAIQSAQMNAAGSAQMARDAEQRARDAEQRAASATTEAQTNQRALSAAVANITDPAALKEIMQHPMVRKAMGTS